jgi:hypothetical protein
MVMPDMNAISAIVASLKGAVDIAQSIKGLSDATAIQTQIFELNTKILTAQQSAFAANDERAALIKLVSQLEEEVARLKAWGSEKEQYEFKQVDVGAHAYVPKPDSELAKQPHWLCTNCYDDGKKSILQTQEAKAGPGGRVYKSPRCRAEIRTHYGTSPSNWTTL